MQETLSPFDSTDAPPPSLRERNRRDTWASIHSAAVDLAAADGPAAVTIDEIAARAGVSRRTFFNYFATKDDAIVGLRTPTVDPVALAAFEASSEPLLDRAIALLFASVREALSWRSEEARALLKRFPELKARMHAHAGALEQVMHPHFAAALDGDDDRAAVLHHLALTVVRVSAMNDPSVITAGDTAAIARTTRTLRELVTA